MVEAEGKQCDSPFPACRTPPIMIIIIMMVHTSLDAYTPGRLERNGSAHDDSV